MDNPTNYYKITSIDPVTGAVRAFFNWNNHELDETVFVDDATNSTLITDTIVVAFEKFKADTALADSQNTPLTPEVSSLIDQVVTQS